MRVEIDPEFRDTCPPLSDEERAALEANVLAEGCRDPLVTWRGRLLDGHHRRQICAAHGVEFTTVEVNLPDRAAALDWVIENAFARRNLSPVQRIELAERRREVMERRARERQREGGRAGGRGRTRREATPNLAQPVANKDDRTVNAQIAKIAGVGRETVRKYREARPHLTDEERARLGRGDLSVDRAHRIARDRIAEREREMRRGSRAPSRGADYRLFTADIREGLPEVEDDSVDWIITDPPYVREHLPVYSDLSRVAARVLRPGGGCLALAAQMHLPETLSRMGEHLEYWWTLAYVLPRAYTQIWARRVNAGWKPVVWYRKPGGTVEPARHDVVTGAPHHERVMHPWEKSVDGMASLMRPFVAPGKVVLDPFLGSGTTGVAALGLGCTFVGCDVDASCVAVAASRLAEAEAEDGARAA